MTMKGRVRLSADRTTQSATSRASGEGVSARKSAVRRLSPALGCGLADASVGAVRCAAAGPSAASAPKAQRPVNTTTGTHPLTPRMIMHLEKTADFRAVRAMHAAQSYCEV